MASILVVDDEPGMRKSLVIMLRRERHSVTEAAGGAEAGEELRRQPFDLVIADLRMAPVSGMDLLRRVKREHPEVEVIVMTAYGTIESAVEAMKLGAFDFITKPFQLEEILLRVRNALDKRSLSQEVQRLQAEVRSAAGPDAIVGKSPAMREVLAALSRFARTDSTVLITGESGTGKELAARALHARSGRAQGPFVSVTCAALPEPLLENELFGHVKGAFTGAVGARKGLFEDAHGGTFFLDEIGEAPASVQAKLLRVLEERSVRRLGDNRTIPVDVRIVAATNRDLEAAVRGRAFREDLFYRLNVMRLHLPPLRERREDIPLLLNHLLRRHAARVGRYLTGFMPDAVATLVARDYPGNVRELSNVVEHAVAIAAGPLIEVGDLPPATAGCAPSAATPAGARRLADLERDLILERIAARQGNLMLVADDLGISRTTLWRRMKEYRIETSRLGGFKLK